MTAFAGMIFKIWVSAFDANIHGVDFRDLINYQRTCMENSVHYADIVAGTLLPSETLFEGGREVDDVCEWKGVMCEYEYCCEYFVREIHWDERQAGCVASFRWFPLHLHEINVREQSVNEFFIGSLLPRRIYSCILVRCGEFGSADFRSLPDKINKLIMISCGISGSIEVHLLPDSLQHLDLRQNPVSTVIVGTLSPRLLSARFYAQGQKIKVRSALGGRVDSRIKVKHNHYKV